MGFLGLFKSDPRKVLGKMEKEIHVEEKASERVKEYIDILANKSEKLSAPEILKYLKRIEHLFKIELKEGKMELKKDAELPPELKSEVERILNQREMLELFQRELETIDKLKKSIEDKLKKAKELQNNDRIAAIHTGLAQEVQTLRSVAERIIPIDKTVIDRLLNAEVEIEKCYKREAAVEGQIKSIKSDAEDEKSIMGNSGFEVLEGPGKLFESKKYPDRAIYQDKHGDLWSTNAANKIHSQEINTGDWKKLPHMNIDDAIAGFLV